MRFHFRLLAVIVCVVAMLSRGFAASVSDGDRRTFRQCRELFESGMYDEARAGFEQLAEKGDLRAKGWAVLCRTYERAPGYERAIEDYADECGYTELLPKIRLRYALNLFDEERYSEALEAFEEVSPGVLEKEDRAECMFKEAYSNYAVGDDDAALYGFGRVLMMTRNEYTAPAHYMAGYIHYQQNRFEQALEHFESSAEDARFSGLSRYYILECRFMLKDYAFVTREGEKVYASVQGERKDRLARMISESYLIQGDSGKASEYYGTIRANKAQGREDLFFAGSLAYTSGDWQGAVENFGRITDRSDSLGQIANYQMGYSYVQLKNKVAALDCFRDAALGCVVGSRGRAPTQTAGSVGYIEVEGRGQDPAPTQAGGSVEGRLPEAFDREIQEDAYYNYAKLSFDINKDGSVFKEYMRAYADKKRNDQIYSYIALAALYDHDYAAAVEAYDEIDELDADMRDNYKKANYLRANQLVQAGAWRDAAPYLKAAAYYDSKYSTFNQLSRYWLAESYYRDGQYDQSRSLSNELYNLSALDGKPEGWLISYNLAYCFFHEGDYAAASKWFGNYLEGSVTTYRRDALVRIADCAFLRKEYKDAAAAYYRVTREYASLDDLYPYYQGGAAYSRAGDREGRIGILSPVRKARPDVPYYSEALYDLGRALSDAGRADEAVECYSQLAQTSSDSSYVARGMLGLGLVERNRNNLDKALSHYKGVVSAMPNTEYAEAALLAIEGIYQKKQEPEEYLAYLDSVKGSVAERSESDKEAVLFGAAEQMCLAGNYDRALKTLKSYEESYPEGKYKADTWFYMGECYVELGQKDQACDSYKKAMQASDGRFTEQAALAYAKVSYGIERYYDAYSGYETLSRIARMEANRHVAAVGMMRSAYMAKDYVQAKYSADKLLEESSASADEKREATFVKGKSLLSMSLREEAFEVLSQISAQTDSPEGAEAAYLLIQDSYDQGRFEDVETKVYAFADSGSSQRYWLAKAFILLGDSFAERDEYKQARATFESVRDGYSGDDEIQDAVAMRLRKLEQMEGE